LNFFGNAKRIHREAGLEQYFVDPMDPNDVRNVWLDVENTLYNLGNHIWGRAPMHANCT
jgi:hypothetical protein